MNTTLEARPTATANAEWVRARLARDGLSINQEPLALPDAMTWLTDHSWGLHEAFECLCFLLIGGRLGRVVEGPGWRLMSAGRRAQFTLLTIARS